MLAKITKLRDGNRNANQSLTSICASVPAGMTSRKERRSPENSFGLDQITIEDAKRRERVSQRHSKGWDPDLKIVGKAINVDIASIADEIYNKCKLIATHRTGANKEAAKITSIGESKKCVAVPHISRQEPLHIIHNEEKIPRQSERGSEVLSKKRNWTITHTKSFWRSHWSVAVVRLPIPARGGKWGRSYLPGQLRR